MMNVNTIIHNRNVIITNHAKQRALQRAKLFLYQHELADITSFLKTDFNRSNIDVKMINCPFY